MTDSRPLAQAQTQEPSAEEAVDMEFLDAESYDAVSHVSESKTGRFAARRARHEKKPLAFRVVWVAAGLLVTFAGLLMIPFPGPAVVVIPAGLAMLALEFQWAERMLVPVLAQAQRAKARAKATSCRQRLVLLCVGLVAAIVFAWAAVAYDIPLLPLV